MGVLNSTFEKSKYACAEWGDFKDDVKSVLRIGSAHNKGGPANINISQMLLFIYEHSKPEQIGIQL